ncbi:hypothetical protein IKN40_00440 [bacterium]|nr:hypothetical protein [bacterium]
MATSSHHKAKNILTAGIFLLNHKAFFRGIGPSKAPSALCGVSLPALNSMSYIGVSSVNGNFSNQSA